MSEEAGPLPPSGKPPVGNVKRIRASDRVRIPLYDNARFSAEDPAQLGPARVGAEQDDDVGLHPAVLESAGRHGNDLSFHELAGTQRGRQALESLRGDGSCGFHGFRRGVCQVCRLWTIRSADQRGYPSGASEARTGWERAKISTSSSNRSGDSTLLPFSRSAAAPEEPFTNQWMTRRTRQQAAWSP